MKEISMPHRRCLEFQDETCPCNFVRVAGGMWYYSDLPFNRSRWITNRPVSYSAGLHDLQYCLYIGKAH
jgi:hypothetical protein